MTQLARLGVALFVTASAIIAGCATEQDSTPVPTNELATEALKSSSGVTSSSGSLGGGGGYTCPTSDPATANLRATDVMDYASNFHCQTSQYQNAPECLNKQPWKLHPCIGEPNGGNNTNAVAAAASDFFLALDLGACWWKDSNPATPITKCGISTYKRTVTCDAGQFDSAFTSSVDACWGTGVSAFFVLSSGSTYTTTNPSGNSETVQDYEVDPAGIILDGTLQATGFPSSAHGPGESNGTRQIWRGAPSFFANAQDLPAGGAACTTNGALPIGASTSQVIHQGSGTARYCY